MPIALTKYAKTKVYDTPLYVNPKSTQEIFPVKSIDINGLFELNNGFYSKCFVLSDINFAGVTDDEQKHIIINFSKVLNSMPCRFSYTVANEYVDEDSFNQKILYKLYGDGQDTLRNAFNSVIKEKVKSAKQGLYQTIYLTLTIRADSFSEANSNFNSIEAALHTAFIQIGINNMSGSEIIPLDVNERMQIWYNFTHFGIKSGYKFDFDRDKGNFTSWLDNIAPASVVFHNDYFEMNGSFGRVMYISDYPKSLESDIVAALSKLNCTNYITISSELLDNSALKQEINRKHSSVGMQIANQKQRNRNNNDFLSDASDMLLDQMDAITQLSRSVEEGDDHYFNSTITVMFLAHTYDELAELTDKMVSAANIKSFELAVCFDKQREGINTTFMFGVQEFKRVCNFSAPCLAMFMPYKTQELNDIDGIYYGVNQLSQNPIFANRKLLQNYNAMILGKSGSGKSVLAKCEIISTFVNNPDDQIIIIDPQNEYKALARDNNINGTIVSFNSQREMFLNPLDVDFDGVDYSSLQEIIGDKTDFILVLLSSCMRRNLDAEEQGILDEVIEQVYSENYSMRKKMNGEGTEVTEYTVPEYMRTDKSTLPFKSNLSNEEQIRAYSPTLQDIYQKLKDKQTPVANKLAAHMQIFVNGSLNLFNHRSNVNINDRFVVFDLTDIKDNLRVTSNLVMLEVIRDKCRKNKDRGFWTHLYIDEFHELLGIDSVAKFIIKQWKEIRKNKGALTGITQNMTDLLQHSANADNLAAILSNTEYFALLNQSSIDRNELIRFLPSVSPAMFNFVESADKGTGLLIMGNTTVPFDMRMKQDSKIYEIVNTTA